MSPCENCSRSLPPPPLIVSLPGPAMMVSAPPPPMMLSSPPFPLMVSLPPLPLIVSFPPPPRMVSLPPPPLMLSSPPPPNRLSLPELPIIVSAPPPPCSLSSPAAPISRSSPARPIRRSLPPRPSRTSSSPVPRMTSLSPSPLIVMAEVKGCGASDAAENAAETSDVKSGASGGACASSRPLAPSNPAAPVSNRCSRKVLPIIANPRPWCGPMQFQSITEPLNSVNSFPRVKRRAARGGTCHQSLRARRAPHSGCRAQICEKRWLFTVLFGAARTDAAQASVRARVAGAPHVGLCTLAASG